MFLLRRTRGIAGARNAQVWARDHPHYTEPVAALDLFSPPVRAWFEGRFGAPTPPQEAAWPHVVAGRNALIVAPTGSGKTLAAFLSAIDRLYRTPPVAPGIRVVYVSPLKALSNDIHRNLEEPVAGIARAAGPGAPKIRTALRTGDTPAHRRAQIAADPPHILVTTPESLFLLLGNDRGRLALASAETVIVDEVHALAGNKRGAHLAITLERLQHVARHPLQRIGCSATVRPADEIAHWLAGLDGGAARPIEVVDSKGQKAMDLEVICPVEDFRDLPAATVWPHVEGQLLGLIRAHRSTLVFVNNRRAAERLAARLNDLAGRDIVAVHHGSVSRERRLETERRLVAGELPALVATSSLELGIDVGAIDLVVQVESPKSAARGLQRVGRAGHLLTETSVGRIVPLYRADLADAAATARAMLAREVERTRIPKNCLDVLAQQIVAAAAVDEWPADELYAVVRRAWAFRDLPRTLFDETLAMVAGAYPAARFGGLRARVDWNRTAGTVAGKPGAARVVAMNAGTIPDRGMFTVVHAGTGARLGTLDEEFVTESRPGDAFLLGSSVWRVERIGTSDVSVVEAPSALPRMPFWRGEAPGRPFEQGRRHGAFARELAARLDDADCSEWLREACALDDRAALALRTHFLEMRQALGIIPDDRTIVIESFRDQVGDVRTVLHSPFGERVHMAWAFALRRHLRDTIGIDVEMVIADDGIMLRFPAGDAPAPLDEILAVDGSNAEDLLVREIENTPLFGMLFREAAARALLLPRNSTRGRMPLHLQRLRSQDLLQLTRKHRNFPILLEAYREALDEHLEAANLVRLLRQIDAGEIQVVARETETPSPFASSFLFQFVQATLYGGDAPRAEWRNRLLALDRDVLSEILSREELRDLLDARAIREVEERVARWGAEHPEESNPARAPDAVSKLRRYARLHGPFHADEFALATGLSQTAVASALVTLQAEGTIVSGELTPGRTGREWCDAENLREIHRRSLALARREVEPVSPEAYAGFLLEWHGAGIGRAGSPAALRDALGPLEGAALAVESIERDVLPARMRPFDPAWLDALAADGTVAWQGCGRGRVAVVARPNLSLLARDAGPAEPRATTVLEALRRHGPMFLAELAAEAGIAERDAIEALWDLAWAGAVSNDRFDPLRRLRRGTLPPQPLARARLGRADLRRRMAARAIAEAPAGGGRWSALPAPAGDPEARAEAWALALLRRYGVVAREMHAADGAPLPWEAVRRVLDRWEMSGQARRGYFVRGLSGLQFAAPDAVERLRAGRSAALRLVSAVDPANAYGSILPLPAHGVRFARVPGSALVLQSGTPLLLVERRGRRLVPLRDLDPDRLRVCLEALDGLLAGPGPRAKSRIEVERFGDLPAAASPAAAILADLGYERAPRAMIKRARL